MIEVALHIVIRYISVVHEVSVPGVYIYIDILIIYSIIQTIVLMIIIKEFRVIDYVIK